MTKKLDDVTMLVLAGVALYVVYNVVQGAKATAAGITSVGDSITNDPIVQAGMNFENWITGTSQ